MPRRFAPRNDGPLQLFIFPLINLTALGRYRKKIWGQVLKIYGLWVEGYQKKW